MMLEIRDVKKSFDGLKVLEGIITKVDKHNRNGMVTIDLFGRKKNVWLAFELVEMKDGYPKPVSEK